MLSSLKSSANAALSGKQTPEQSLSSLDAAIARIQTLKRKMEGIHEEEKTLQRQLRKRIQHLQELYTVPGLTDVKYDQWSRIRLNRLLVDYLLRNGYEGSAKSLAREKGIEDLVDLDVFNNCHKIAESLRQKRTIEALAWCAEHKASLKNMEVSPSGRAEARR